MSEVIVPVQLEQQLKADVMALRNGDPLTLGTTLRDYSPQVGLAALRKTNLTLDDLSKYFGAKGDFIVSNVGYMEDPAYDNESGSLNFRLSSVLGKIDRWHGVVFDEDFDEVRSQLDQLIVKEPSLRGLYEFTSERVRWLHEIDIDPGIEWLGEDDIRAQIRILDPANARANLQIVGRENGQSSTETIANIRSNGIPGETWDAKLGLDMHHPQEIADGVNAIYGPPGTNYSHLYVGKTEGDWMIGAGFDDVEKQERTWRLKVRKIRGVYVIDLDRHEKIEEDGLHWDSMATVILAEDHSPVVSKREYESANMSDRDVLSTCFDRLSAFGAMIPNKKAYLERYHSHDPDFANRISVLDEASTVITMLVTVIESGGKTS